jgi:UDP-glucose:(heptosyl)LPS alpha-1,3-glucosyltransferase
MDIGIAVLNFDAAEGTGGYTVELVSRLTAAHRVTVYALSAPTRVPPGVTLVRVPALRGRAYAEFLTFPLAFGWARQRHDVVHVQGWTAQRADVVTAHIVFAAWRDAVRRAGGQLALGERLFGGVIEAGERRLMQRGARCVIAPSAQAKADIARWYGRRDDVAVIHHGFPPVSARADRGAARRRLGVPEDAFAALYAGDARKGLGAALDATAQAGTHLLVASRSQIGPFQARAQSLGIASRVHWLGALQGLTPALAAADVLLHPTVYDSFALVVAEAMAAGVPPIVTRHAGASELIVDRVSGWLLSEQPAREGAEALSALSKDGALLARLGEGARAVARGRTWDDVARETTALYTALT